MRVGIEAINFYGGGAYIKVSDIFEGRDLDKSRFSNLLIDKKSVALPCEDPVTHGVNAAKPIIDNLSEEEKNKIELVITSSESGIDFGKSMSTYIHDYLGLSNKCRLFEVKQACYAGTAAFKMASAFIASNVSHDAKALVISSDVSREAARGSYAEPSQATGAIAMLISSHPHVLELDQGADGIYGREIMDTCRPRPELETGDADLSLLAYLDCLENCYNAYTEKIRGVDILDTFGYMVFHAPFGGMVKGAHRKLMREHTNLSKDEIERDFDKRVLPSLYYCKEVGNIYAATVYLALCGLIDSEDIRAKKRISMYSYGSGSSAEFYSGIISPDSKAALAKMDIKGELDKRYVLDMQEYDNILNENMKHMFGVQNYRFETSNYQKVYDHFFKDRGLLVLDSISDFHRTYRWS